MIPITPSIAMKGTYLPAHSPNLRAGTIMVASMNARETETTLMKKNRCAGAAETSAKSRKREATGFALQSIQLCRNESATIRSAKMRHVGEKSCVASRGAKGLTPVATPVTGSGGINWIGQYPPVPTTVIQTGSSLGLESDSYLAN